MNGLRKCLKSKKGINTILAALLMVVIVVVASVMVYAWSTGLLGSLMGGGTGNVGKEALIQDTAAAFSSNANVTIYIRNTGTASATLQSYYVKDSAGDTYQLTTWNGPTIAPNQVIPTALTINTSCGSCVLTGSSFIFVSGNAYTVLVVTSRNTQFTFSVTR